MNVKPLAAAAALLIVAQAASAQVKPQEAAAYRKSAYHVLIWNWMPLANMVRGKNPYNKAQFELYSNRVANIAPMLLEAFPKGSNVAKSESKPEIWTNWADFTLKMKNFESESAKLALLSKTADFEQLKGQFGKVGGTCKACHDLYKRE